MNYESYIREVKQIECGFSICRCLDFWGDNMCYYGCYENKIYTDGFKRLEDLIKEYPELKKAIH